MNEQVAESVCQLATGVADLKLFSIVLIVKESNMNLIKKLSD